MGRIVATTLQSFLTTQAAFKRRRSQFRALSIKGFAGRWMLSETWTDPLHGFSKFSNHIQICKKIVLTLGIAGFLSVSFMMYFSESSHWVPEEPMVASDSTRSRSYRATA
jgi:hypothetical protein